MKDVMGETRRLAAIMAIVVVGYSRLIGDDEAGTARAVREHREAVRSAILFHRGMIPVGPTEVPPLSRPDKVVQCA
jgi:hypothetical protein